MTGALRPNVRALRSLGDRDHGRLITILDTAEQPIISGVLIASIPIAGRVTLTLDVAGLRVDLRPLPGMWPCRVHRDKDGAKR